jgi:hypothetical protein
MGCRQFVEDKHFKLCHLMKTDSLDIQHAGRVLHTYGTYDRSRFFEHSRFGIYLFIVLELEYR